MAYKYYDEVIRVAVLVYFRFAHSLSLSFARSLARSPLLTQQAESIGPKRAQRVRETYTESEQGRNKVSAEQREPPARGRLRRNTHLTSLCQLRLPALDARTFHWQNTTDCDIYLLNSLMKINVIVSLKPNVF